MPKKKWVLFAGLNFMIFFFIGFLFYDNFYGGFLFLPLEILLLVIERKWYVEKKKRMALLEFREFMISIMGSLQSGYSVENCMIQAKEDLDQLYKAKYVLKPMLLELVRMIASKRPLNQYMKTVTAGLEIKEIDDFFDILVVAKSSGGNLVEIISKTVQNITASIDVSEEIETMIAEKKFEQRIMVIMPFFVIAYLRVCSPDYIDKLYHNPVGWLTMSLCLIAIGVAIVLSDRMIKRVMKE